jgi:hypothetical protein
MDGKQAALLVHALAAPDREWVLSHLPPPQRKRLAGLLQELRQLGIPRDPALLPSLRDALPPPAVPDLSATVRDAGGVDEPGDAAWLAQQPVGRVASVLRDEPPAFVAKLLACRDWPWAAQVAQAHGLPVPDLTGCAAPRFEAHACRCVVERLRSVPAMPVKEHAAPPRARWWRRFA